MSFIFLKSYVIWIDYKVTIDYLVYEMSQRSKPFWEPKVTFINVLFCLTRERNGNRSNSRFWVAITPLK